MYEPVQSSPHVLPPVVLSHVAGGVQHQLVGAGQWQDVAEDHVRGGVGDVPSLFVTVVNDLSGTVTLTEQILLGPGPSVVMFVLRTESPPVGLVAAALLARVEIISRIALLTEHSKPIADPLY